MRIIILSFITIFTLNLNAQMDSTSYSVGLIIAKNLKSQGITNLDQQSFNDAFNDVFKGNQPKISLEDANVNFKNLVEANQASQGAENKNAGEAFLASNAKEEGVMTTASGLQYKVLEAGDASAVKPALTDKVNVHYHGTLIDGTVFDSSVDRGEPISFPLNGVITGWQEGLQLMKVGEKFKFVIPAELAYGARATGSIPPNSTLIFEVELLDVLASEE